MSRGTVIVEGEQWLGRAGHGRFLRRERRGFMPITPSRVEEKAPALVG
jgi:hypothetical protein